MSLNTKTTKKAIIFTVFFVLLLSISPITTQKVHAQATEAVGGPFVPTSDSALNITAGGLLKVKFFEQKRWTWKALQDTASFAIANTIIEKISANLQNRILKAANLFVSDLKQNLIDLENNVGEELGANISVVEGCFPNLDLSPVPSPAWKPYKFGLSITCTPKLSNEMKKFYEEGGFNWDTFKKMTVDPTRYNPFAAEVSMKMTYAKMQKNAKERRLQELGWGRGMKGVKNALTGLIKTPAASVQGMADWAFSARMDRTKQPDALGEVLIQTISAMTSNALDSKFGANNGTSKYEYKKYKTSSK